MSYIPVIGGPAPYSSLGVIVWGGDPDPKVPSFATRAEAEQFAERQAQELNDKAKFVPQ